MSIYQATARNFSAETENRIHSDEVAAQFGFAGALVPGAAVFGHMIHVGSTVRFRRLLRVGDEIEVRTVPTRKWRRKGHEFVSLAIAYLVEGVVATEIQHVSIFRVRSARPTKAKDR